MKLLMIDLVNLVKLQPRLCFEGCKYFYRLRGERSPVHKKENAFCDAGPHEPVNFVHESERLTCAGGHSDEHVALVRCNRLLNTLACFLLIWSNSRVIVRGREKVPDICFGIAGQRLQKRFR